MSYAPSPEARAIAAASIKGSAIGSTLLVLATIILPIASGAPATVEFVRGFPVALIVFMISFVAGCIATGVSLLLFGALIARLSRTLLNSWVGLMIAIISAVGLSLTIGGLLMPGESAFGFSIAIAAFALPAAILYRQEILVERIFD